MARAKKSGDAAPGRWTYSVGLRPHTVTVYERSDKSCSVWMRWSRKGTGLYDKMPLRLHIRDERGRVDTARRDQAEAAARKAYNRLLNGEDPRTEAPTKAGSLTIRAGLEHALAIPGMYAVPNQHWCDMSRYGEHILAHLPSDVRTWEELTSTKYETLWRNLAHWRVRAGERTRDGEIAGKRATELAIVLLAQAGRWLTDDGKLPQLPKMPKKEWRDALYKDWATITGDREIERDELRHTPEELGLLWQALDANRGDPRIRLVLRTAAEARLGQALRCDRTMLDLSATGAHGVGRFTVPDTGKKKGVSIDLTPALRAAWDHELADGYLADLEAAYIAGRIRTYPLFPSGRLAGPGARAKSMTPIDKGVALDRFHDLERAAGVAVVPGRGWYGVRRISADLAEDVETDGRALNAITGHQSDDMRRRVYQQKKRDLVLAKAAAAREAARQKAIEAANTAGLVLPTPTEAQPQARRPSRQRQPRKSPTYARRACLSCGAQFTPTGPNTKACEGCSPRRVRAPKMSTATLPPAPAMTPPLPPDLPP